MPPLQVHHDSCLREMKPRPCPKSALHTMLRRECPAKKRSLVWAHRFPGWAWDARPLVRVTCITIPRKHPGIAFRCRNDTATVLDIYCSSFPTFHEPAHETGHCRATLFLFPFSAYCRSSVLILPVRYIGLCGFMPQAYNTLQCSTLFGLEPKQEHTLQSLFNKDSPLFRPVKRF